MCQHHGWMGTIATGLQAVQQQKSKKCPYQTKRSGESTDLGRLEKNRNFFEKQIPNIDYYN